MSSSNTNTAINPKPCNYGCGLQIYWNTSTNEYWEVFTKKKHNCPNRSNNNKSVTQSSNNKPNYYNVRKSSTYAPKPKMSNSLELLQGPIAEIQKKYEILSDIITELGGKTHGSQSHIGPNNSISLVVYYEVPEGKRDEIKQKFVNLITSVLNRI